MTSSLIAGCLWVLAATGTAMLSMRQQMAPGLLLLVSAPVLIVWIALTTGWWLGLLALLAFLSMFRQPLGGLLRPARGRALRSSSPEGTA